MLCEINMTDIQLPGVMIADTSNINATISFMDKITNEWMMRAARGECEWICSDCCCSDPSGMPDQCFHGAAWCTEIIQRDKKAAKNL